MSSDDKRVSYRVINPSYISINDKISQEYFHKPRVTHVDPPLLRESTVLMC